MLSKRSKVIRAAASSKMKIRTYQELMLLPTFEERFQYLKLEGSVGISTFGFDRYMNQKFYRSDEWKALRNRIIVRDNGCDLASEGREIYGKIYIHHMNPISQQDILDQTDFLLNPDFLICTTHRTHNAIHYGDEDQLLLLPVERSKNDTCPWKQ